MAAPKTANINITIGSTEYVISHKNFSELKVSRTAKDVNDSFELSILDNDAYEIEGALLSGNNYIQIDYVDDDLKVYKSLGGFVFKLGSSFINNRNMLTISGFVSTSIKDKYEKYSTSWNVVPKFKWSEVLGDAGLQVVDANYNVDAGLDKFGQNFSNFLKQSLAGWKFLFQGIFDDNWNKVDNYKNVIDNIFDKDLISIDKQGNYYVQKYKREGDSASDQTDKMQDELSKDYDKDNMVKSDGSYVIPIKPHKLIKLICCGGKFSDLLEEEYTDYKGTAFYKSDYKESDWYFIKKWFEKMGSFDGLGYGTFNCNYDTLIDESEYIQTKQSFMEFLYKTVLSRCVQEVDGNKYANFYLSFDEGSGNNKGSVTLSRLDASVVPTNAPKYTYYGKFEDDGKNKGRMTSFNPKLDILTSMITQGTYPAGNDSDLSKVNLIGGEETKITVSASKTDDVGNVEGRYNVKWGLVKITTATPYSSNKAIAETDIIKTFNTASELAYRASATIEGFNTLTPQSYIEIVLLPKNNSGQPTYHHMSGIYFILSIEDRIADGRFTSSLELIKNINNIGNTAIVEETEQENIGDLKYSVQTYNTITSKDTILSGQMKMNSGNTML